jgi:ANTAR domain-containing protein
MERYQISGDRAFLVLTRSSQSSNRKLQDVAAALVESGTLPGAPVAPRPTPATR